MNNPLPPSSDSQSATGERLDGWKEIAVYLKRDPRTVQRWEKTESLPVHRHVHEKGGTVFAFKSELDTWWNQRREKLEPQPPSEDTHEVVPPSPARPTSRDRILLALGVAFVLFLMAFLIPGFPEWITNLLWGEKPPSQNIRLAVLPFEDLGGDTDQRFFSEGLTQELISEVGRLEGLDVIAWTTVRATTREGRNARQIGHALKVEYLLEGSVRRAAETLRVTAELVRVEDQTHLWAENYDRETSLAKVLDVQEEISHKVADSLERHLLPAQKPHPAVHGPVNTQAFVAYLQGRYFWNQRTHQGLQKALEYFQESIRIDPNYAPAHSGLADTYGALGFYSQVPSQEAYLRAREEAQRALQLDPTLAEAHVSLADVYFSYDYDFAAARREYSTAIQLNPSHANAHHWFGLYLLMLGQMEPGWVEIQRALELDPLSPIINTNVALYHYYAGDYDRVIAQGRKALELFPDFSLAYFWIARAHLEKKEFPEALAAFEKSAELEPENLMTVALLGHAYGIAGETRQARAVLRRLEALSHERYVSPELLGLVHLGLGDKEGTIAFAEKAYEEHAALLTRIKVEPILAELRTIPRFQALMQRVGFQK